MGIEMDLLDGALFSQAQAKQDPNSLAAKLVGAGVPWAAESRKRQGREPATDALTKESAKRKNATDRAKTRKVDDELLRRDPEHYAEIGGSRNDLDFRPLLEDGRYGYPRRENESPAQRQYIHDALREFARQASDDRLRRYRILHNLDAK